MGTGMGMGMGMGTAHRSGEEKHEEEDPRALVEEAQVERDRDRAAIVRHILATPAQHGETRHLERLATRIQSVLAVADRCRVGACSRASLLLDDVAGDDIRLGPRDEGAVLRFGEPLQPRGDTHLGYHRCCSGRLLERLPLFPFFWLCGCAWRHHMRTQLYRRRLHDLHCGGLDLARPLVGARRHADHLHRHALDLDGAH